jgi:hypothetical protein
MKFVLSKIKWDTDHKRIPGLPKEMTIEIDDDNLDYDDIASLVVDTATDIKGWCIADADVKACVETAPDGFDAVAFNEGKPTPVAPVDSTTAIGRLATSTGRSLKKNAELVLKVAKPEVLRIDFYTSCLDPESEPYDLTRKVDEWVGRGSRFIYVLETDSEMMLTRARDIFQGVKSHERDRRAYARLNDVNKVLYVGSSSSLGRRFREHLGYGARGTYALHLSHWARNLIPMRLFFTAARYPPGVDSQLLGLMEDQLWDTLRPMFGRRGRR